MCTLFFTARDMIVGGVSDSKADYHKRLRMHVRAHLGSAQPARQRAGASLCWRRRPASANFFSLA